VNEETYEFFFFFFSKINLIETNKRNGQVEEIMSGRNIYGRAEDDRRIQEEESSLFIPILCQ
jgi:hypothetical protein